MVFALLGWLGTACLLLAYGYLNAGARSNRRVYFALNLLAGTAVAISSVGYETWQSVAINGMWAVISVWALVRRHDPQLTLDRRVLPMSVAAIALAAAGLWGVARPGPAITVLGWSSVVAFILNYLLFAARRLPPHWFHLANLYAPLSLMPQLLVDRNWPVVGLETSWAILAIWGLWRGPGAALAEPS